MLHYLHHQSFHMMKCESKFLAFLFFKFHYFHMNKLKSKQTLTMFIEQHDDEQLSARHWLAKNRKEKKHVFIFVTFIYQIRKLAFGCFSISTQCNACCCSAHTHSHTDTQQGPRKAMTTKQM